MKKIVLLTLILISLIFYGCSSEDINVNEGIDKAKEVAGEKIEEIIRDKLEDSEQVKILKEYYSFIQNRMDEDKILNFLKDNIQGMDEFRVDEMILELENLLFAKGYDTKGVLEKVAPYLQNASDELRSYFKLWESEVDDQVTDGEKLNVPVEEIINRALSIEEHIEKYPDGKTKDKLEELYTSYLKLSTQGLGNPYIFADEGENHLKEEILQVYVTTIKDNPDSIAAKVLTEYLQELEKDEMALNGENVYHFYDNIDRIIDELM